MKGGANPQSQQIPLVKKLAIFILTDLGNQNKEKQMIAKINYETIHGDVGLGSDAEEYLYFETFEALQDWTKASEGDGYLPVLSESDRADFINGGSATLLETEAVLDHLDGRTGMARHVIVAEFFSLEVPEDFHYESGNNGTVIAFSNGNHVDTVSGDGWWGDGEIIPFDSQTVGELIQEFNAVSDRVSDRDPTRKAARDALEYATNCVPYDILEGAADAENALKEYVGS